MSVVLSISMGIAQFHSIFVAYRVINMVTSVFEVIFLQIQWNQRRDTNESQNKEFITQSWQNLNWSILFFWNSFWILMKLNCFIHHGYAAAIDCKASLSNGDRLNSCLTLISLCCVVYWVDVFILFVFYFSHITIVKAAVLIILNYIEHIICKQIQCDIIILLSLKAGLVISFFITFTPTLFLLALCTIKRNWFVIIYVAIYATTYLLCLKTAQNTMRTWSEYVSN